MDTTGRKTHMTTIELPPEPPIGKSVQDALADRLNEINVESGAA